MGYIEGLLGGFVGRKREYEAEQLRSAEQANTREAKIFETLLNSPDKETRDLATAGLLQSAEPMRRKGGLRGWLGEMEASPYLQRIRDLPSEVSIPDETPEEYTGRVGTAPSGGMISAQPSASLAQPGAAATQPGAPPLTTVEPRPVGLETIRGDETPQAAPPQAAAAQAAPGAPPIDETVTVGAGPPILTGRTGPRQIFQTREEELVSRYAGQERGELEGVIRTLTPYIGREAAVKQALEERQRARGGGAGGYQSVPGQMPDGTPAFGVFDRVRGVYIDPVTQRPLDGFQPRTTTGSVSLGTYYEQAARALGYKSGALAPTSARPAIEAKARELAGTQAGAVTSGRGEAAANVPLSTPQRFQATKDLTEQWTKASADRREMERQFSLMQSGLSRFDADPIGASQAVLVTFQKVLDPTSVVRESEYARSPAGLALLDWLEGKYEQYKRGGVGVPKPILAEMVKTAEAFLNDANMKSALDNVRQRVHETAISYEIDPRLVLGADLPRQRSAVGTTPTATPAVGAPPPGATGSVKPTGTGLDATASKVFVDAAGNLVYK
jgi:hypothetical protein